MESPREEHVDEERPATAYDETETGPIAPPAEESPEPDREAHSEPAEASDEPAEGESEGQEFAEGEEGILVGTESERAPGVGLADHPAPAAVRDPETGHVRVAGEAPANTSAGTQVPVGDSSDEQAGDVEDAEARERLNAVTEPEPIETDRPDLGTE